MLKKFFEPYEEYTLHTTLPLAELRPGLERSCPRLFTAEFFSQRVRWLFVSGGEPELAISRRDPIRLYPATGTRNSLRGRIELLPLAEDARGTRLHVTIRPPKRRWFFIVFILFAALWSITAAIMVSAWLLFVLPGTILFVWLLLIASRELARNELPALKASLENKLRKLEADKMSQNYNTGDVFQPYSRPTPHR